MRFDLITLGRVSMDLLSQQVGAPFANITGFDASVGGSPANIAIGAARLGARAALVSGVGEDHIGTYVLANLRREGVDTSFVRTVPGAHTGLAVVGIEPPDRFPLTLYRADAADLRLTTADVDALPLHDTRALLLSGAALAAGTCAHATLHASQRGAAADTTVVVDLDLRPTLWRDSGAYGPAMRALLPHVDVVVGTEEEVHAALCPGSAALDGSRLSDGDRAQVGGLLDDAHAAHPGLTSVLKRGEAGVTIREDDAPPVDVPPHRVEVVNTVGAGDAFAAGLLYGHLQGWPWPRAAAFGNACGAIEVTRQGCSRALPTLDEVTQFLHQHAPEVIDA